MSKINWTRLLIGGLVATIILLFTDGLLHERLLEADWKAIYDNLGARALPDEHNPSALVYFAIFELGRGFLSLFIYVLIRPLFSPGPKTATLAGVITWLALSVAGPAQFIPLGFYSHALWLKVAAFQLITSVVACIAGAALYKETGST